MYDLILLMIAALLAAIAMGGCCFFYMKKRKLRKNYLFERKIIGAIPVSMFLLDKNKQIINIYNIEPAAMAGHEVSDIVGKHLSVFADDPTSPFYQACSMLNESFDRMMVSREDEYFQYMINDAYLEATIKLLEGDYILSIVREITRATKTVKDALQKKQNEISVAMKAGNTTSWSYHVDRRLFSSTIANMIIQEEMPFEVLLMKIHVDDRHIVTEAFDNIINKGEQHCEFTARVTDRNGIEVWNNVHAVPDDLDENGRVKTIVGSQKDVTEQITSRNELIHLREKAEEANQLKSAFIANMSHEIRTPLNAIIGFSNLISTTEDKEEIEEYVKIIEQNNSLLLNIINDVLDLSKVEASMIEFCYSNIRINEMLNTIVNKGVLNLKEGVKLTLDTTDDNLYIESDQYRLMQVLSNFLSNAIKFTYKGTIRVGYKMVGDEIYFYVSDTGIGISEENLGYIFKRFAKVDNFIQGTGLGLPICETIIKHLGGSIGVDSVLGEGSTFWCQIPKRQLEE